MKFDYDLFVIGGGSGGVRAARVAAAETGARVGLAEEDRYGGTCVIRGCVPKKLMVYASGYGRMVEDARLNGWAVRTGNFDWPTFQARMAAELDRLEGVYRQLLAAHGVETFDVRATVQDAHTVALADGRTLTAKHILVATGGRPQKPGTAWDELGITSAEVFLMPELPKSMLIVGGGFIACEFAGIMNGFGVEVTQYYRGAQILRGFDDEARGLVCEEMNQNGIEVHLGTNVESIDEEAGRLKVRATNGDTRQFDTLLCATGRTPNTRGLGLENAGVEIGRWGEVVVNEYSQSTVPSIHAIGDVTDRISLTPVAISEAMAFVDTVFRGNPTPVDHAMVPSAVFSQPELGTVGLSEEDARDREVCEIYSTSFRPMPTAFVDRSDRAMMKLVVSKATRKVLGCHIVGPGAGEMIQLVGIALKMGATKEDFDRTMAVHPTMSEELVLMRTPVRTA